MLQVTWLSEPSQYGANLAMTGSQAEGSVRCIMHLWCNFQNTVYNIICFIPHKSNTHQAVAGRGQRIQHQDCPGLPQTWKAR